MNELLPWWMLKIAYNLVVLPLSGDSWISQLLKELERLGEGNPITLTGLAFWCFSLFGAFYTVLVHLAEADTAKWLFGLGIRGVLPNGRPLRGTRIGHAGESATLLYPGPAI